MTAGGRLTPAQRAEAVRRGQQQFRRELAERATADARRLRRAYVARLKQLDKALGLDKLAASGTLLSDAALRRTREQVREALQDMTRAIEAQSRGLQAHGIQAGLRSGAAGLRDSGMVRFSQPSVESIRQLINYVDSAPFQAGLARFAPYHAEKAADIILDGASRGLDPIKVARELTRYLDTMPLVDAIKTTRTVQLWSARGASHEIYRANADVLGGWMWSAARDTKTCMACLAMDGKIFPLEQTLNGHHLCRCAPVPVTRSWGDLGFEGGREVLAGYEMGVDRFAKLSDEEQQAQMGAAAWRAWKDGRFQLEEFARAYQSPIYGSMTGEASLTQLVGEELARVYEQMGRAA